MMLKELENKRISPPLQRIRGLLYKEILQIMRDPSCILIALVLPLMLIFLFGYAINLDANNLKLGVVVEAPSPTTNQLAYSFIHSQNFDVTYERNVKDLQDRLTASDLRGFIIIPENFNKDYIRNGIVAPLQTIADGSEYNTAILLQNYVLATYSGWLKQNALQEGQHIKGPISMEPRVWYNPANISRFFLLPGSIAVIMTVIGTLLTALVIAREWETGTMESILVTRLRLNEIVLGKLIPYFFLGMTSFIICLSVSLYFFDLPLRGSFWILFLVTSLFLITALSFGLLISSYARNQMMAAQLAIYSAFLPAFTLSGFIFEIDSMPEALQKLTYLIPARYFVTSLKTLFLVGDVYHLLLLNMLGIMLLGFFFLGCALFKFSKRLD